MLKDRLGLTVATMSSVARDAYVVGVDLLCAAYPGGRAAFDRAIEADPSFVLAHVGRARAAHLAGDAAAMRESFARAEALSPGGPSRGLSQIEVFRRLFAGKPVEALAAVRIHMATWPRDALVLSLAANQSGLIGISGLAGREQDLADFLGRLAREYGDDWFFNGHYGMALSELGQRDEARVIIERSLAQRRQNGYGAHAYAHLCYESGDLRAGIAFLREWLRDYDRAGAMFGHLNWHLGLYELQEGDAAAGFRLYDAAFSADDHRGAAHQKVVDSVAYLWRSELAGHPRDPARWLRIHDYACAKFTRPGMAIADWHVALSHVATQDHTALAGWIRAIEDAIAAGSYPAGTIVPTAVHAFAAFERRDYDEAIRLIASFLHERERMGGSRAQGDLVDATLMRACVAAGRTDELRRVLSSRRPGPPVPAVAGLGTLH